MSRTTRRKFTGSKRFDPTCRSHGSCPWCEGSRLHAARKREASAEEQEREAKRQVMTREEAIDHLESSSVVPLESMPVWN